MLTVSQKISPSNLLAGLPSASQDRIAVVHYHIAETGELGEIAENPDFFHSTRVIVVDTERLTLSEADVASLVQAAAIGIRVVLAGPKAPAGFPPLTVQYEPDFRRAVVGSIYGLQAWSTLAVISPLEMQSPILRGLARHALSWRASWQEVENGDLSSHPQL